MARAAAMAPRSRGRRRCLAALIAARLRLSAGGAPCFRMTASDGKSRGDAEVLELLRPWISAAAAPGAAAGGGTWPAPAHLEPLLRPLDLDTSAAQKAVSAGFNPYESQCHLSVAAYALAVHLQHPEEPLLNDMAWDVAVLFPAEFVARSEWPLFELVAGIMAARSARDSRPKAEFLERCRAHAFWADAAVRDLGRVLAAGQPIPEAAYAPMLAAGGLIVDSLSEDLCDSTAALARIAFLALLPSPPITSGYVTRTAQSLLIRLTSSGGSEEAALRLEATPWPLWRLLAQLAAKDQVRMPGLRHSLSVQDGREFDGVNNASSAQLLEGLRVTHNFLSASEIPYSMIAGTLLGAARHFARIPWDDDADLCVDSGYHGNLVDVIVAQEAQRYGIAPPKLPALLRRGLAYLRSQRHRLRIVASRSMTFTVSDEADDPAAPHVDIWECWGLADEDAEVRWASYDFGPKIPKDAMLPLRKMPFGPLLLWGPADPDAVLSKLFSTDWRSTCVGRKVHTGSSVSESDLRVPCSSLRGRHSFAEEWRNVAAEEPELLGDLRGLVLRVIERKLPGCELQGIYSFYRATMVGGMQTHGDWYRMAFAMSMPPPEIVACEALFRRAVDEVEDLTPATLGGVLVPVVFPALRSLVCRPIAGSAAVYVWEDPWL